MVTSSHLACIKPMWIKAHETMWNCELVYSIDREKPYQLILWQEFIQEIASHQVFISGKMVFQITQFGCTTMKNDSVFLMKLLKLNAII